MPKINYIVIGGKQSGKPGKTLSRHTKLKNAKASAKKHANNGYRGAIYQVKPMPKNHPARKFLSKEDRNKKNLTYHDGWLFFNPEKGVVSTRSKKRRS
jgi:hypothetical protein